jgi:hypothetical protein
MRSLRIVKVLQGPYKSLVSLKGLKSALYKPDMALLMPYIHNALMRTYKFFQGLNS